MRNHLRTHTRAVVVPIVVLAVVAATAATALLWNRVLERHALVPGVAGCRFLASNQTACVADRTVDAIRSSGLRGGLAATEQAGRRHGAIEAVCHAAMHRAARDLFDPHSVERSFTTAAGVGGLCGDGFGHGTFSTAIEQGDAPTLHRAVTFCNDPAIRSDSGSVEVEGNCFHSIGHGLRSRGDVIQAAGECRRLPTVPRNLGREACLSGVFMEDTMREPSVKSTADARRPCDVLTPGFESALCYGYLANKTVAAGWSWDRTARECLALPRADDTDSCLFGVGAMLPTNTLPPACAQMPSLAYGPCMFGFIQSSVVQNDRLPVSAAAKLCASGSPTRRRACSRAFGSALGSGLGPRDLDGDSCDALASASHRATCRASYARAVAHNSPGHSSGPEARGTA